MLTPIHTASEVDKQLTLERLCLLFYCFRSSYFLITLLCVLISSSWNGGMPQNQNHMHKTHLIALILGSLTKWVINRSNGWSFAHPRGGGEGGLPFASPLCTLIPHMISSSHRIMESAIRRPALSPDKTACQYQGFLRHFWYKGLPNEYQMTLTLQLQS